MKCQSNSWPCLCWGSTCVTLKCKKKDVRQGVTTINDLNFLPNLLRLSSGWTLMTFEDPKDRTRWMDALRRRLREYGIFFSMFFWSPTSKILWRNLIRNIGTVWLPSKLLHRIYRAPNCPWLTAVQGSFVFFGTLFFQIWIFNLEEFLSPRSTCNTRVGCPDGVQEEKFREVRCQMDFSSEGSHGSRGTQKS